MCPSSSPVSHGGQMYPARCREAECTSVGITFVLGMEEWGGFVSALLFFCPPHKEVEELWPGSVFLCTQTAQSQFMTCQKSCKWPRSDSYPPRSTGLLSMRVSADISVGGCWWAMVGCTPVGSQVTEAPSAWLLTWEISDQKCPCTALPWEMSA